ncbi:arginine--tRNA ligase [Pontibacter sp. BT310]|uniref:Arginine--tRNA ligase n=1 Tax=Pontibacter populi TaxID=890055 RepID=A0ABS6XCH6_9BACT|nr:MULTISPECIES: arginine--tRNA ligase [Pontibacter]MBJ6118856.1 arginine--tRNA ligase [Pontibacter sp. BT310]MBR0571284.1 arginine--tRNA ligase [Microvirga sp. STS03]MBW3365710.1 arginine--tRNA ligase [Pontibacter populi]
MQLQATISKRISEALQALFNITIDADQLALQPTRKEFAGSFTFVTFPYTKQAGKGPEQIGQALGEYLKENAKEIKDFNVVKGFLNLEIEQTEWLSLFRELMRNEKYGYGENSGKKVMVEYSSPNTNKPLHLGHLRNNFLGYSVSEILKANGHDVMKANLVNDRGIHICKSMLAYQKFGNGETPASSNIKGDHLAGKYYVQFDKAYKEQIDELVTGGMDKEEAKKKAPLILEAQEMLQKWEQNDKEVVDLWKQMNGWVYEGFDATYKNIGVDFDKFYYESETYMLGKERVEEGLAKGVFFKKEDGSVWVDLTDEGLDEKLLLRADGTSVYITQDMGTAELKYNDFPYDQSIYVVADEQNYHFQVLKAVLKKLGKPYAEGIYHLSYGMVDLPSGKMKSREGTVVDADELVQEMIDTARQQTEELGKIEGFTPEQAKELYHTLAMGALKYFLLKVDPKKRMLFNPQESIDFRGNTGPFIQYTHARIAAILRKAGEMGLKVDVTAFGNVTTMHEAEQEVITQLVNYSAVVEEAGKLHAPSVIANYAYELAKAYNRFYQEISIFNETDEQARNFRIALSAMVARFVRESMGLLGIAVPERM